MTRKHFRAIAEALKGAKASPEVCLAIASAISQFNPYFDRTKFLEACGGE